MNPTHYFTTIMRTNGLNDREWFVERFPINNSLRKIHVSNGQAHATYAEAENHAYGMIAKEGGRFLEPHQVDPKSGTKKGIRRGPYKPRVKPC